MLYDKYATMQNKQYYELLERLQQLGGVLRVIFPSAGGQNTMK